MSREIIGRAILQATSTPQSSLTLQQQEMLAREVLRLLSVVDEVHSWAVCAGITDAADMAQNFPRIVEITGPAS